MRHRSFVVCVFLIMQSSCWPDRHKEIYDGFETSALTGFWDDRKFLPGALEMQKEIVRKGKSAAKIILRPGDQIASEKQTILERAELTEASDYWSLEDSLYSYSFSIYLPADFPVDSTRLVIAQWKQECEIDACTPDNPLVAVRYVANTLSITHLGPELKVLYEKTGDIRERWLDFRFDICFSRTTKGSIKAWINGKQVVDYLGINAYPNAGGYPDKNFFYFKTGLYRDKMDRIMTIYFDEYRKIKL